MQFQRCLVQCGVCSICAIEYSCRRSWGDYSQRHILRAYLELRPAPLQPSSPPSPHQEHEYFAQNAVCYITHIIIGKSTAQRILSPSRHTYAAHTHAHNERAHTHTERAMVCSLMQASPPILRIRPVSPPTAPALMWHELRTRSRTRACLTPLQLRHCSTLLASYSTYPLLTDCPLVSWHAVASRG